MNQSDARSSGVLLHVTSIPSTHGMGDLGPGARRWIELLSHAGQKYWQFLPLGPTGKGNSPYQSFSAVAGNPLLISLEDLAEEGLLGREELSTPSFPFDTVDYDAVAAWKMPRLKKASDRFFARGEANDRYEQFAREQSSWLEDYALFMSLRNASGGKPWQDWSAALVKRDASALAVAQKELAEPIRFQKFLQYIFDAQLQRLRQHAAHLKVKLIGDVPIFVATDSADAWAHPGIFQFDSQFIPTAVAGCPPDFFSEFGQRWNNPLYDWDALARQDYAWWIRRIEAMLRQCDLIRLDHFRGFESYWRIPIESPDGRQGKWEPGPGAALFAAIKNKIGRLPFIAEDLGVITPEVDALRDGLSLPGMRIMQFGFDGNLDNIHLPHFHPVNSVAYTGTHDNDTTRGWFHQLPAPARKHLCDYIGKEITDATAAWALIHSAWGSVAKLAITTAQDILNLPGSARMNMPGTTEANWKWRMVRFEDIAPGLERLKNLTRLFGR